MRRSIPFIALATSLSTALQLPNLQPFLSAFPISISDYIPQVAPNASTPEQAHEHLKRQSSNACPSGFNSCANLGAPGLCCGSNALCAPDQGGHVACCPSGAACTGRISGVVSSGTIDASGDVVGGGGAVAGATGSSSGFGGLATASASTTSTTQSFESAQATTSGNGLVLASTQTTAADGSGQTSAGGGGFIVDGSSTVATPGAAVRAAEMVSTF